MTGEAKHRKLWACVFIVLIAVVVAGGVVLATQRIGGGHQLEIDIPAQSASEMKIYLSGAVVSEGIYDVGEDYTIHDLLQAAGGVTEDADISKIKIQVLRVDENPFDIPEEPVETKININTASFEMLQTLTNIGPVIAQNIIDYRDKHGPFRSVDELKNVKRIGDKTLDDMRDDITVVD